MPDDFQTPSDPPVRSTECSAARPKTIDYELYCNLRHQYDLRLAELEQAKADRNKAAMMERRKYLPKLRALQDELRKRDVAPPNAELSDSRPKQPTT